MGVLNPNPAGFDAPDAPGLVAEEKDVAGQALDSEVLVDLTDEGAGRILDHVIVSEVGDGAAGRYRCQTSAASGADHIVDAVAVQISRATAAAGGDALAQHLEDLVEILAGQVAEWVSAPDEVE